MTHAYPRGPVARGPLGCFAVAGLFVAFVALWFASALVPALDAAFNLACAVGFVWAVSRVLRWQHAPVDDLLCSDEEAARWMRHAEMPGPSARWTHPPFEIEPDKR